MRNSMVAAIQAAQQSIAGYEKKKAELAEQEKQQKKIENMQKWMTENKDNYTIRIDKEGNPIVTELGPREKAQKFENQYKQQLMQKKQQGIALAPEEEYALSGYRAPAKSAMESYYESLNAEAMGGGQPQQPNQPRPTAQPGGQVKVKSPEGQVGTIPENQLDEALKAGYPRIQ